MASEHSAVSDVHAAIRSGNPMALLDLGAESIVGFGPRDVPGGRSLGGVQFDVPCPRGLMRVRVDSFGSDAYGVEVGKRNAQGVWRRAHRCKRLSGKYLWPLLNQAVGQARSRSRGEALGEEGIEPESEIKAQEVANMRSP